MGLADNGAHWKIIWLSHFFEEIPRNLKSVFLGPLGFPIENSPNLLPWQYMPDYQYSVGWQRRLEISTLNTKKFHLLSVTSTYYSSAFCLLLLYSIPSPGTLILASIENMPLVFCHVRETLEPALWYWAWDLGNQLLLKQILKSVFNPILTPAFRGTQHFQFLSIMRSWYINQGSLSFPHYQLIIELSHVSLVSTNISAFRLPNFTTALLSIFFALVSLFI